MSESLSDNAKNVPGKTEEEVLKIIDDVVKTLAFNFTFGYYSYDDIAQEGRILALKILPKYNPKMPLQPFIYRHIKNRLINLIRDKFHRSDNPCKICKNSVDGHTKHADGRYCKKYLTWKHLNATKSELCRPLDISNLDDTEEPTLRWEEPKETEDYNRISKEEIFSLIDIKLPANIRGDYLRLKAGLKITKAKQDMIVDIIKKILTEEEITSLIKKGD